MIQSNQVNITTFNSLTTTSKVPVSPYETVEHKNNIFDFTTTLIPLSEVHTTFAKHFVLSSPIYSTEKLPKLKTYLQPLQHTSFMNYIILDFDKVYSIEDVNYVLEFFKNNNYSINIFKSKSHGLTTDKGTSYNIKGVMVYDSCYLTSAQNDIREAIVNYLNSILNIYCEIDIASSRLATHQAPTYNEECLLYVDGTPFKLNNLEEFIITKPDIITMNFDNDISGWFYNHLITNYGATFKNGTSASVFRVSLPIEVKSKFGYFWTRSAPYILQHPQRTKNINMFGDFIVSPEGKEYIKKQHIQTLQNAFTPLPGYHFTNRYFTVNDTITSKVKDFIDNDKVLVVKGIMGSGKSSVIQEFLKLKTSRVLLITMRRSLALDMSQKYNIKNYIDDLNVEKSGYKVGDSLIVQIDSIHKINPDDFDYCVIDEVESLSLYVDSNLKNSTQYVKNVKYLKMMFEKKILVADAFINEFTLKLHFGDREKLYITNDYKDTCNVYVYEHKQTFVTLLEQTAIRKADDEFITCSFGTLSELFSVERLLKDHGLRVISITSDTTEDTKEIMYKLFQEKHHNKYDVVLFSPTITVGVSILNNVKHHFHYDSGKSIDPISSIQMLKRSRTVDNVHIFIKGKQTSFKSYDVKYLNEQVTKNIKEYLNDSRNMIFYNIDDDSLSNVGKFVNHFVAHSNFFNNDHENTFKFLLTQQFENIREIEENIPHHKFEQYIKEINSDNSYIRLFDNINKYSDMNLEYDTSEIQYLQNKTRTDDEERALIILDIHRQFPKLDKASVLDIAKELIRDQNYINKINAFIIYVSGKNKKDLIEEYALTNISKVFLTNNKDDYIKLLKFMSKLDNIVLQDSYSINDLKILNQKYSNGVNFSWFLNKIGYTYKTSKLVLPYSFRKIINVLLST